MTRNVDHIVETHRIAAELRAQGKPTWAYHLRALRYADFEESRDAFADALRRSTWFRESTAQDGEFSELWVLWDEIKDTENVDTFDFILDEIYDLADIERCHIEFIRVEGA
jgi:hypothetical protein